MTHIDAKSEMLETQTSILKICQQSSSEQRRRRKRANVCRKAVPVTRGSNTESIFPNFSLNSRDSKEDLFVVTKAIL